MNKHNTIGDRLKEWINTNELSASDFAKQLQIQRSALSHIFSGRNKPSVDVLIKIKNAYPDMSLDWLITGKLDIKNKTEESKKKKKIMMNLINHWLQK
jgi:transcriptional regulator with XRE-family HTH domain